MPAVPDAAYRALLLLAAAIAPHAVPVDVASSRSVAQADIRLAIVFVVVIAVIAGIRKTTTRHPWAAALATLPLLAAPIAGAWFEEARGPVARGVSVMGPLVWAALAAMAAGPGIDVVTTRASRAARAGAGVAVIGIGVLSILAGRARYPSRESFWRAALVVNPANESAALAVAAADRTAHAPNAALDALRGCLRANPRSCACAEAGASTAIDLARYPDARHMLDGSEGCLETPRRVGLEAEALVGTSSDVDEGLRKAAWALERDADEMHAVFAGALGAALKGRSDEAALQAQRAVALGRGVPAELLYGGVLLKSGDLVGADAQFARALAEDPTNVQATYDHALVCDRQHRYDAAHEGYVRTLALDPMNADARYGLIVLTYFHGATAEARYQLGELAAKHPADDRLPDLRQLVAAPAAAP